MRRETREPEPVVTPGPGGHHADLRVGAALLEARFARDCATHLCAAACCRSGVWLDPRERDRVLDHADAVRAAMDPDQPRDTRRWFSRRSVADPDFPSGRAVHTRVRKGRCVFLNGAGRCVLQKASSDGEGGLRLKPFFCTAFPVTVDHGVLTIDDARCRAGQPCCAPAPAGPRTVFETCPVELRHVLGDAGLRALRRIAKRRAPAPRAAR